MNVPRIVLASTALSAVVLGSLLSVGDEVAAQTATVTATASTTVTASPSATATTTSTATVTATSTATASATGTPLSGATATVTGQMQPVSVSIPTSVYSTPGTLTAYVNGQPCGTVTISGTAAASYSLPSSCAASAGQAISFRTSSGTTLPQTVTIPSAGGSLVLGATQTTPLPPATGNAGLLGSDSPEATAAMLGLVTLLAAGATVVTRRFVRA